MKASTATLGLLFAALFAPHAYAATDDAGPSIVEEHPSLKDYLFVDPPSRFNLGIGIVPLGVAGSRFFVGADIFQLNWTTSWLDWQLLNATVGASFGQNTGSNARYFLTMTEPKLRLSHYISVGVMGGAEFVTFPNVQSELQHTISSGATYATPVDSFSTSSLIYGVCAAEYFDLSATTRLKINETVFRENYSVTTASSGWAYNFSPTTTGFDTSTVAPSTVLMVEVSILY